MEAWVPLFDIFLNSPTPESEASRWLQQSFTTSTTTSTSTSSFLSLLSKPVDVAVINNSSDSAPTSSPHQLKCIMWIQTLPNAVQSRILSFLRVDSRRFCKKDLCLLANNILRGNQQLDFWVKKAAHNLLDVVSESNYNWVSSLSLESSDVDQVEEEFETLPSWLQNLNNAPSPILPWLPISYDELRSCDVRSTFVDDKQDDNCPMEVEEGGDSNGMEVENATVHLEDVPLDGEIQRKAISLKAQIVQFESTSKTISLANEICQLFSFNGGQEEGRGGSDPLAVFSLMEPWEADDETASILLSHLSSGGGEDILWQCQVLCAIILPKMLVLSDPASRVLVKATVDFCKLHQKASVDALLFPVIFRKEGINTHVCDVVTRIFRECLHTAHVSSFCQKLLCGEQASRRLVYLPSHRYLISDDLVWTESLFTLFQNILNHNVYLTEDSIDHLVTVAQKMADSIWEDALCCLERQSAQDA
ncbi:fanconi anemia group E protein FANCE protein [Thalictrum thalictroides]|uniref:Fanconi anemia group E protein FANCE protein n=1 Tax=Thalictrum thalictroides TaxID=46969 RepID=A0A7J6W2G9_THATH|nr:fanconi anemia group E protein FANCE protein [Thalictrum thalictroides]